MSLILRKTCQSVLDDNGLGQYHVDISQDKFLSIVGECGQPLVNISGISFHKFQPTRIEIDYAAELLDGFIGSHMEDIQNFIKQRDAFSKLTEPTYNDDKFYMGNVNTYNYMSTTITYTDNIFKVIINREGKVTQCSVDKHASVEVGDINEFELDPELYNEASFIINVHYNYWHAKDMLDEAKGKLSRCDI